MKALNSQTPTAVRWHIFLMGPDRRHWASLFSFTEYAEAEQKYEELRGLKMSIRICSVEVRVIEETLVA